MIRYLLLFLFFIIAIVIGAVIAAFNGQDVTVNYQVGAMEVPLVGLVFSALVLGALCGMFIVSIAWTRAARRGAQYKRHLKKANKEIDTLKKLPASSLPDALPSNSLTNDKYLAKQ